MEIFKQEIEKLLNDRQKKKEVEQITKAVAAGSFSEADVLFKYSSLTVDEYNKIKRQSGKFPF